MQHLTLEALARLVDEAPDAANAAHLAACGACRLELEALKDQSRALGALPDIEPAADTWPGLQARLRAEGLLQDDGRPAGPATAGLTAPAAAPTSAVPGTVMAGLVTGDVAGARAAGTRRMWANGRVLRHAATIALFLFGGAAGFTVRGLVEPASVSEADRPSGSRGTGMEAVAPSNAEEAARLVNAQKAEYVRALTRYAELAELPDPPATADPVARLAALESIVAATRAALGQAPADPIINGYHLTALAQREATLRHFAVAREDDWF